MNQLYQALHLSRQSHQKWRQRQPVLELQEHSAIELIMAIRADHPRMGLRKIYDRWGAELPVGRDHFMAIGDSKGLKLAPARSFQRTTVSSGERQYPNLLVGMTLNRLNRVWVADITYYRVGGRFSFISLLMDLYSRRIVGYAVAPSLHATWSLHALETALSEREINAFHELLHHTDCGTQYLCERYRAALRRHSVAISTAEIVYENTHAERLNGIIKQEYLDCWSIRTHDDLERLVPVAVERINHGRPHRSLGMKTPVEFEQMLQATPHEDHPSMTLWPPTPLLKLSDGIDVPYKL